MKTKKIKWWVLLAVVIIVFVDLLFKVIFRRSEHLKEVKFQATCIRPGNILGQPMGKPGSVNTVRIPDTSNSVKTASKEEFQYPSDS